MEKSDFGDKRKKKLLAIQSNWRHRNQSLTQSVERSAGIVMRLASSGKELNDGLVVKILNLAIFDFPCENLAIFRFWLVLRRVCFLFFDLFFSGNFRFFLFFFLKKI